VDAVAAAIHRLTGRRPRAWHAVSGGCSPAGRARVELEDGATLFAKWGTNEATARYLREELVLYRHLRGDFMPAFLGWDDALPLLLIEDLGAGLWPPPWHLSRAREVVATLRRVHRHPSPDGIGSLAAHRQLLLGWERVAADPAPFLSLGLASAAWLRDALPALRAAAAAVPLAGDDLLHLDARGDNLCFRDARVVLVDWNWACIGNGAVDLAFFAVNVPAHGGPEPEAFLQADGGCASLVAGYFAAAAGLPEPPGTTGVRALQQAHLRAALPWAARRLGLPPPVSAAPS